jgi:hypothetical protein
MARSTITGSSSTASTSSSTGAIGALGAAINERALEAQLAILADTGSNAICTSHNPPGRSCSGRQNSQIGPAEKAGTATWSQREIVQY